jgi:tetratricopeptide (TPR) repeat protein
MSQFKAHSPNTPSASEAAHTIAQGLQQAIACHRAARWQEAAAIYEAVLVAVPKHPDANHNFGLLCVQTGKITAGLPYLLAAIDSEPTVSSYWLSYIEALILDKQYDEARQVFELARTHGLEGSAVDALAKKLSAAPVSIANA